MKTDQETKAFVQGAFSCIDLVHPFTGRSEINGETLEQIQARYPGAEIVNFYDWCKAKDKALCTPAVEIDEDRFMEMLEVLPPQNWQREKGFQSFELSEHLSGRVTSIFCATAGRFFAMSQFAGTETEILRAMCAVAMERSAQ